jgi:hypothetical protein
MGVLIILLIVAAFVYLKWIRDPKEVRDRCKNRSEEQKKVIRYFMRDGCLAFGLLKDEEYDALVAKKIKSMDFKQKALNKIGLDESELQEIEPVSFEGYWFDEKKTFSKYGKDKKWRSSAYQISWLFFSSTQVYLYQYTFNLDEDGKMEKTEEYFYKDITNFQTISDTIETPIWDPKKDKSILVNIDKNRFAVTVPGDKFLCSMEQNEYTERAIQAMKAKLREKKNA